MLQKYRSIAEIKAANTAINNYFFSKDTMRFFHSRIINRVYKGIYFITSEQFDSDSERLFTVRMCVNGSVETVGRFQAFATAKQAAAFIKTLPVYFPDAYKIASDTFNERNNSGLDFVTLAQSSESNSVDTLAYACKWLTQSYKYLDMPFIEHFTKQITTI